MFPRPPPPIVQKPMELEVKAEIDIHHYDNTPTNDNNEALMLKKACDLDEDEVATTGETTEDDLESLYPSVPLRTSSILPRPAIVPKGETFRSYINLKDLDPPAQFPPDKNSPMSPPPQITPPPANKPPKLLPPTSTRSASVASSIKSKLYASV